MSNIIAGGIAVLMAVVYLSYYALRLEHTGTLDHHSCEPGGPRL